MGLVVDRGWKIHGSYLAESVTPYSPIAQMQLAAGEAALAFRVRVQALVLSFQDGFMYATAIFLAALLLVLLLKKPAPGAQGPSGAL